MQALPADLLNNYYNSHFFPTKILFMKKHLFFSGVTLLLILINIQKTSAQNVAPFWSTTGNSNATATSKLGTTNAINLRILTNNLERIRINASNGFVGLGTVAPSQKLHVVGNGFFTGSIGIGIAAPTARIHIVTTGVGILSTSSGNDAILGQSSAGSLVAGVHGKSTSGSGIGVKGESPFQGVYGNGGSHGVFGHSDNGTGVYGQGGTIGTTGEGKTYGVFGFTPGTYGVFGSSTATTGVTYGVYGSSESASGYGVYGVNTSGSGTGVYGTGFQGVWGVGDGYGVIGSGGSYGVAGFNTNSVGVLGSSSYLGVYGLCNSSTTNPSYGVLANNFGSTSGSYGVFASGLKSVWGECSFGGGQAITGNASGASGYAGVFTSSQAIGVYAYTGNANSWAGYFLGRVFSSGGFTSSDRKLKQNITDVTDAMDIINKLQPKNYEFRHDGDFKYMNLPEGKHYGLIAQDVEQVLPNLVAETSFDASRLHNEKVNLPGAPTEDEIRAGVKPSAPPAASKEQQPKSEVISFKALNYTELIPVLVKAMQEVGKENESLKNDVADLKKEIADLKDLISRNGNGNGYPVSGASLEQNSPNPFNGSTTIRYHLPSTATSAQLMITDMNGNTIKSISLDNKQSGQVTLAGGTLPSGNYTYTLWMNGKQIDSKKMVIAR
jgi:hypothetical protein